MALALRLGQAPVAAMLEQREKAANMNLNMKSIAAAQAAAALSGQPNTNNPENVT
jgi:hypothetical protein